MPAPYNGDTTGITGHPTVTISEPIGTDVRNSASMRTPLRRLADFAQYVATYFALSSEVAADIATHNAVTNPHSATTTATASHLVLRDAAGRAAVATPAAPGDIATMGYVDGKFPALAWTQPALGTNWIPAYYGTFSFWKDANGVVHLKGGFMPNAGAVGGSQVFASQPVLPVGYRPAAGVDLYLVGKDESNNVAPVSIRLAGGYIYFTSTVVTGHNYTFDGLTYVAEG
jgi:hypothetical protein